MRKTGIYMKKTNYKKEKHISGKHIITDPRTDEKVETFYYDIDDSKRDSNFYKLFLNNFISSMESITNQKTNLVFWLLQHMTKKNEILYTYRQISESTGMSYGTVADTMKTLQNADFLRKHNSGYYMINPDIIYKGTLQRRCMTLELYRSLQKPDDPLTNDIIRLEKISKSISRLEKKRKDISERVDFLEYQERLEKDQIE